MPQPKTPDQWYIDPSSYRIDRNHFPTEAEAVERAAEAARILGRGISVWQNTEQGDVHVGKSMPDGKFVRGPSALNESDGTDEEGLSTDFPPDSNLIIGTLDEVADALDERGAAQLAEELDRIVKALGADEGASDSIPSALNQLAVHLNRVLDLNPRVPYLWAQKADQFGRDAWVAIRRAGEAYRRAYKASDRDAVNRVQLMFWILQVVIKKLGESGE